MMTRKLLPCVLVLLAVSATTAFAAPWNGMANNFSFASTVGGDGAPFFSAPTVNGNALVFNTQNFSATSVGGVQDTKSSFIEFTVQIDPLNMSPGLALDFVSAAIAGDINVNGEGSMVDLDVTWEVRDDNLGASLNQSITGTTPVSFPHSFAGDASDNTVFTGDNTLGGIGSQVPAWGQELVVRLDIGILADSTSGTSDINIFGSGLELGFFFVPEPATVSLLLLGGFTLIRRRRR